MRSKRHGFFKSLSTFIIILMMVLLSVSIVDAKVLYSWPDWVGGRRTLRIFVHNNGTFRAAVQRAVDRWNAANAGQNNWNLVITNTIGEADIRIGERPIQGNYAGLATPYRSGSSLLRVDISIEPGAIGAKLENTIAHELGHCMRLADTWNVYDIMYHTNTSRTNPNDRDVNEATASDKDPPPCALQPDRSVVRGETTTAWLYPNSLVGAHLDLENVENISIESLTGDDFTPTVLGWNDYGIEASFNVSASADHNEVFGVRIDYQDHNEVFGVSIDYQDHTEEYTGILWVADEEAPAGEFPHAVAGDDIIVPAYTPAYLDGTASYHDNSEVSYSGTWLIDPVGLDLSSRIMSENEVTGYGLISDSGPIELPPGKYTATLIVTDYYGRTSTDSITITVESPSPGETPVITVDRTNLNFGAIKGISGSTASQSLRISNSGQGTLNWSISADASWLTCAPTSGINSGAVTVSVDPSGLAAGTYTGTITITDEYASNSPQTVTAKLTVKNTSQDQPPFGSFETPVHGSTVSSSIPVTGWALDDVEVKSVKIYNGSDYVGDAVFVEGARPDVAQAHPDYPLNYRAGWGYMMLTNFLPNGGNGTYHIQAIAEDTQGNKTTLGTKTIICDNEHAVKPFGAIDTPTQGGTASGSEYINWGWALTPQPNHIPTDGSTINVWVDGVNKGHVKKYNIYREDIATLFPHYNNSEGAAGLFSLDTTGYADGVHTIQWTATDNANNTDGIGSRYFTIDNSSGGDSIKANTASNNQKYSSPIRVQQLKNLPIDYRTPVKMRKGFGKDIQPREIYAGGDGLIKIEIKELERIELDLSDSFTDNSKISGYLMVGDRIQSLPIGSTLKNGVFYWMPGLAFFGEYRLVFIKQGPDGKINRKDIMVKIGPKFE